MSEENKQEFPENTIPFDPKQVEKDMIAAAEARAQDPGEMAATMYRMYVPHFKAGVTKLSTRALRRVLLGAVLYPLEQNDFKGHSEFEKQMIQLVSSLLECKFVMIMDTFNANAEKIAEEAERPLTEEEAVEIEKELNKENNNG